MTRQERLRQSPKGLIEEIKGPSLEEAGFRFEPVGPDKWAIKGPDPKEQVRKMIQGWGEIAKDLIRSEGLDPQDFTSLAAKRKNLDRGWAAAQLIKQLFRVAAYLRRADDGKLWAVAEALQVAHCVYNLAIIDNENSIHQRLVQNETLVNRNREATRRHARWREEASNIQSSRSRTKPYNATELATKVKKNLQLKETVDTIRKQLGKI
jgi:hypothetical protein